jgi:hypothetical protein
LFLLEIDQTSDSNPHIEANPPTHPVKRVRQSFAGFSTPEWDELGKARNFARWIGRSESLLRNVENRIVPLSTNLARRISERTGVSEEWLLSDPPENSEIPARNGGLWDPLLLLDPLVLGDYDFRNALPMAPRLVLQLALAIVETGCVRALQENDHTPLVRLMDLIKREMDLYDPQFISDLAAKLDQPEYADALQLWVVAGLAAKQRRAARGIQSTDAGA